MQKAVYQRQANAFTETVDFKGKLSWKENSVLESIAETT